jgi:hypothetical protein
MPMTLSGDGTITGLAAGGLPDSSIATADIANAAITAAKLDGAQSGSAPIYAARAWVNFNGTGTVAIRASGNVSSITDNGTGDYTVNFTTALADANYNYVCAGSVNDGTANNLTLFVGGYRGSSPTTTSLRIVTTYVTSGAYASIDSGIINVSVFR